MTKSIELLIDGRSICVAEANEQKAANVTIASDPHHAKSGLWPFYYWVHGFRWGDTAASLEWTKGELKEGARIEIKIGIPTRPPDLPSETPVTDERDCNFCHKPSKDVPLLFQGDVTFSRICSNCVKELMQMVTDRGL